MITTGKTSKLRIAYLTNTLTGLGGSGGSVHVSQIAGKMIRRGHQLYTNMRSERAPFVILTERGFVKRGAEIGAFYVRIHGAPENDELTLLRQSNIHAPCIWELNAPLEELRTLGRSERKLNALNMRRKKLARMVDAAICVSAEMEEYAREELGINKTFVIPNGSDPDLFTPQKRDPGVYNNAKYNVLWSGSPRYGWQGLSTVRDLAAKLAEKGIRDVCFFVTADGESTENLIYLGHVPYADMPRYIASADVGLCIYEQVWFYRHFYFSPLKLYDYMASGIPVIGTNAGQIKFAIEEQENGLLTDNTIEDLIEKILFLKNHPDTAHEMGLRGRRAVCDEYNWDNVVSQTESVIMGAVGKSRKVPGRHTERVAEQISARYRKTILSFQVYHILLRRILRKCRGITLRAFKRSREKSPQGCETGCGNARTKWT